MRTGIAEIIFVDKLGGNTPACVNRKTGVCLIQRDWWKKLNFETKYFILLHEQGHIVLNTSNEFLADDYAFNNYVKGGHSLKKMIYSLTRVLSYTMPEHYLRTTVMLDKAKEYDAKYNKNKKLKDWYKQQREQKNSTNLKFKNMNSTHAAFELAQEEGLFGGIKNRIGNALDAREDKKAAKNEIKYAKADKKRSVGDARLEKAKNGQSFDTDDALAIADKASSIYGQIAGTDGGDKAKDKGDDDDEKKDNTMLYVGIGVAIFVVLAVVIGLAMKGKTPVKS